MQALTPLMGQASGHANAECALGHIGDAMQASSDNRRRTGFGVNAQAPEVSSAAARPTGLVPAAAASRDHMLHQLLIACKIVRQDLWVALLPLVLLALTVGLGVWAVALGAQRALDARERAVLADARDVGVALGSVIQASAEPSFDMGRLAENSPLWRDIGERIFPRMAPRVIRLLPEGASLGLLLCPFGIVQAVYPPSAELNRSVGAPVIDPYALGTSLRDLGLEEQPAILVGPYQSMSSPGLYVMLPQHIVTVRDVDMDEDFGLGAAAANTLQAACGTACYSPVTRTKFWGISSLVVNFSALLDAPASKMSTLSERGYQWMLTRPTLDADRQAATQAAAAAAAAHGADQWQTVGGGATGSTPTSASPTTATAVEAGRADTWAPTNWQRFLMPDGTVHLPERLVVAASGEPSEAMDDPQIVPLVMDLQGGGAGWQLLVAPEDGWGIAWRAPLEAMVVIVAVALSAGLFVLLLSRRRHQLLLASMLPKHMIDQLKAGASFADKNAHNQARFKTAGTAAEVILDLMDAALEGGELSHQEIMLVRTTVLQANDIYAPLDLGAQIQQSALDADVVGALKQLLLGRAPVKGGVKAAKEGTDMTAGAGGQQHGGSRRPGDFPEDPAAIGSGIKGDSIARSIASTDGSTMNNDMRALESESLSNALLALISLGRDPPPAASQLIMSHHSVRLPPAKRASSASLTAASSAPRRSPPPHNHQQSHTHTVPTSSAHGGGSGLSGGDVHGGSRISGSGIERSAGQLGLSAYQTHGAGALLTTLDIPSVDVMADLLSPDDGGAGVRGSRAAGLSTNDPAGHSKGAGHLPQLDDNVLLMGSSMEGAADGGGRVGGANSSLMLRARGWLAATTGRGRRGSDASAGQAFDALGRGDGSTKPGVGRVGTVAVLLEGAPRAVSSSQVIGILSMQHGQRSAGDREGAAVGNVTEDVEPASRLRRKVRLAVPDASPNQSPSHCSQSSSGLHVSAGADTAALPHGPQRARGALSVSALSRLKRTPSAADIVGAHPPHGLVDGGMTDGAMPSSVVLAADTSSPLRLLHASSTLMSNAPVQPRAPSPLHSVVATQHLTSFSGRPATGMSTTSQPAHHLDAAGSGLEATSGSGYNALTNTARGTASTLLVSTHLSLHPTPATGDDDDRKVTQNQHDAGPTPPPVIIDELSKLLEASFLGWTCDAFALDAASGGHPLSTLAFYLMRRTGLVQGCGLPSLKLARFLRSVEDGYRTNPYHNRVHAADVLQTLHVIVIRGGLKPGYVADPLTHLAVLLAAVVHDLEHVGLTNDFLVATDDMLAQVYNDRSPMENHHLAAAFGLLRRPSCAFLRHMSRADMSSLRKMIIDLVLGTDMKMHFALTSHFKAIHRVGADGVAGAGPLGSKASADGAEGRPNATRLGSKDVRAAVRDVEAGGEDAELPSAGSAYPVPVDDADQLLALQMALKCADLGHLAEDLPVHKRWVAALEEEFFQQGDRERAAGLPVSPLFDRGKPGVTKSQVGFFDFVVLPLFSSFTSVFTDARPMLEGLQANYNFWKEQAVAAAVTAQINSNGNDAAIAEKQATLE